VSTQHSEYCACVSLPCDVNECVRRAKTLTALCDVWLRYLRSDPARTETDTKRTGPFTRRHGHVQPSAAPALGPRAPELHLSTHSVRIQAPGVRQVERETSSFLNGTRAVFYRYVSSVCIPLNFEKKTFDSALRQPGSTCLSSWLPERHSLPCPSLLPDPHPPQPQSHPYPSHPQLPPPSRLLPAWAAQA
jgi:hypothetical protein